MAIEDIQARLRDFEEGKREVSPDDRGMLRDVRGFISRALQGGDPESAPILERVGRDWALDLLHNRWLPLSEELIRLNHRLQDTYHIHNGARRRTILKEVVREIFDPEVEQNYYREPAGDLTEAVRRALRASLVHWVERQGRLSPLMFMERLSELHLLTDGLSPRLTALGRYFLDLDSRRGMTFLLLCDLAVGTLSREAAADFLEKGRSFRSESLANQVGALSLEQCEWLVALGVANVESFQYFTNPPGYLALRSALIEEEGSWSNLIKEMASLDYKLERPRQRDGARQDLRHIRQASTWFARALDESLKPVQSRVHSALRYAQGDGQEVENLEALDLQLDRMVSLAQGFMRYMRAGEEMPELVSISEVVAEALAQWRGKFPAIQITVDVEDRLPAVTGARADLKRAFLQLLNNAASALEETKTPQINIAAQALDGGARIKWTLSDNGTGVAPVIRDRLFEPGVSTRSGQRGMGLAFVQRVVKFDFMGDIIYAPNIAGGSDFTLFLPTVALSS